MRRLLLAAALLLLGNCRRVNASYCDATTPCRAAQQCDLVARECVGGLDLGIDLAAPGDGAPGDAALAPELGSPPDLTAPPDLKMVDLAGTCTSVACNQNPPGNLACKTACMTTTAKCGGNNRCTP